ncbi:unnamed protein product [Spodoptera littoralis]|uniref:Uncharacterized protein n=1 Tax=Spodoptera littoralis TaxID=7109 RepID=A0A9P0N8E9_SPOLI|nr:unnamed protein product [Spodoptera littoralis]
MKQLGDDETDYSNWPGGPITDAGPKYEMDEMQQDTPDMSQFPDTQRHFGKDSATDVRKEAPLSHSTAERRHSRYFAWPSDNREPDAISMAQNIEDENQAGPPENPINKDPRANLKSILRIVAGTAKKLMGRVSDPELTAAGDELLLEEDAEATEALLKQFEKAKKQEKDVIKRQRTRKQSLFFHAPDETTEKHLVTLDMGSMQKLDQSESDHLPVKPLTTIENSNALRLGKEKSKVVDTVSKVELTIDIEGALAENETKEKAAPSQSIREFSRIQATQGTPYISRATTSKQPTQDKMTPTSQIPKDPPSARKLNVPSPLSYPEQRSDQKSTQPDKEKALDSLAIKDKTKSIAPMADTSPPISSKAPLGDAREEQLLGTSKSKDVILKSATGPTPTFIALKEPSKSDESRLERSTKSKIMSIPVIMSSSPAPDSTNVHRREEEVPNIVADTGSTRLISEALVNQHDTKNQPASEAISSKLDMPQNLSPKVQSKRDRDVEQNAETTSKIDTPRPGLGRWSSQPIDEIKNILTPYRASDVVSGPSRSRISASQNLNTETKDEDEDIQSVTDTQEIKLRSSAGLSASYIKSKPVTSTETVLEDSQVSRSSKPAGTTSTAPTLATAATEPDTSKPYIPITLSYLQPNINQDIQRSGQNAQPVKDITNISASKPSETQTLRESKADTVDSEIPETRPDEDEASLISGATSEEQSIKTVDLTKPSTVTVYEPALTPAPSTAIDSRTVESSTARATRKSFMKKQIIYDPNRTNYDDDDNDGTTSQGKLVYL